MNRWRLAWTITKLKVVRALLTPLLRWHIKKELKKRNDEQDRAG